jgi:hypothetical protein
MELGWVFVLIPIVMILGYDYKNRKIKRKSKHLDDESNEIEDRKRLEAVGMAHSNIAMPRRRN